MYPLAVCWAIKWQFLRCQKNCQIFLTPPNFRISECVTICKFNGHLKIFRDFGLMACSVNQFE